jgi:murein L,D-transpeptidase YcbB/YkuD
MSGRLLITILLALVTFIDSGMAEAGVNAATLLADHLVTLEKEGSLDLEGEKVIARGAILSVYEGNGNIPIWTDPDTVERMLQAVKAMRHEGLDPEDYHNSALAALGSAPPDRPSDMARRDILLTDSLFLMSYHLHFGKADPAKAETAWNYDDFFETLDLTDAGTRTTVSAVLREAVAKGEVDQLLERARPSRPIYGSMRDAFGFYLTLAEAGGWTSVPEGPTLREGEDDPRVAPLRARLCSTGDLRKEAREGTFFDLELAAAVKIFQERHGLDVDGSVGRNTLAALNVTAAERADQLRCNLDRARWVLNYERGGDFVLVNICAYETRLFRGDKAIWQARVQVGKPFTRSPVFAGRMTYMEFNPTWTVPVSIANRSILPKIKKDPGYLANSDMVLLDSSGQEVSSETVDWATVTRMPYTVRQNPGPKNVLGQVKFIFPNEHAVYLHDTSSRHNFNKTNRAFSSGCIRVENPMELATLLLEDQDAWDRSRIDDLLSSGKRTRVRLTEPLPVFLLYWTAYPGTDGRVNFRKDLYDRDPPLLATLKEPTRPHGRHIRAGEKN